MDVEKGLVRTGRDRSRAKGLVPNFEAGELSEIYQNSWELTEDIKQVASWLSQKQSPHTRRAYGAETKRFMETVRKPFKKVEPTDCALFMNSIGSLSSATRARSKAAVSSFFSYLLKVRYISHSPVAGLDSIRVQSDLAPKIVDSETVRAAIKYEPIQRNKDIIDLLYVGGLRRDELLRLKISDFRQTKKSVAMIVTGKGQKTRTVYLPLRFWELVERNRGEKEFLFQSKKSDGISASLIYRVVKEAFDRVGAPEGFSPHWLRHSHATNALKNGVNLRVVQKTLGHAGIATTERYLHVEEGVSSAMGFA